MRLCVEFAAIAGSRPNGWDSTARLFGRSWQSITFPTFINTLTLAPDKQRGWRIEGTRPVASLSHSSIFDPCLADHRDAIHQGAVVQIRQDGLLGQLF